MIPVRTTIVGIATLVLTLGPAWAADHSGTVVAVDPAKGTIVIDEIGPWQTKGGKTISTHRTFVVEPATQFVTLKRRPEPGPSGWRGEFVEAPLGAWAVSKGDFVTVRVEEKEKRSVATRIAVTAMAE
jgi:hypothetical protein